MASADRHNPRRFLVLSLFCLLSISFQVTTECDRTFVSRPGGPVNGTFTAPSFLNPEGHSRQCIYTFLAGPRQRVELIFTAFSLRGTPPECIHEYMDVYSEVQQPDPRELINSPFGGRYCGPIPPRRRISLYRALALSFYTDKNASTPDLFAGRYNFINDTEYEIGTPVPNTPCSFTVNGTAKRSGFIVSPTYPGAYPKELSCSYQFMGQDGQRVRLEFRDFDLFFGGMHCPFDYVKVFDGMDTEAAVIGTYCGQQRNLVLYSSESSLLVTFVTLQRNANTQNRGFKGIFEFSESFVKLDFIGKNDGEHIRGSECDQKILSKKKSSGFVFSPNYPYPYFPKIVCRYFIYGMQDSQHLERVRLNFTKFDIPKGEKGDCSDGYLKIYLKGQEATDSYDKFDHEMCGDESKPKEVVSDGPRLVMVFSSGELQGRGFKAKYTFETEYRIPGTAAPDGSCSFTYRSSSRKKGEFNSPRYPSNYPSETNCTYLFLATPNEQVSLVFDHFKVRADTANTSIGSYGSSICQEDWLEMYNMYRDGTEKLIGRYCGMTAPGPIESNVGASGVKILLHSDHEGVFSGFKARYTFEVAKSIFGDCGSNLSSTSLEYGVISSPNYPANYDGPTKGWASKTCNWYVNARPKHKILLYFDFFAVEGEPSARGCPAAVVRLWHQNDGAPLELCGEKAQDKWQYLSEGNSMRITFISADKSVGAQGFHAVWTEVQDDSDCNQFSCAKTSYCIADRLKCNSVANCGQDDASDEQNCPGVVEVPVNTALVLAAAACACFIVVLAACLCCHHRKRRRRRRHLARRLRRSSSSLAGGGSSRLGALSAAGHPGPGASFRSTSSGIGVLGVGSSSGGHHMCDALGERFATVDSV